MSELKHTKMLMHYADGESAGVIIHPSRYVDNIVRVSGIDYSVPNLNEDEVTQAYNSVVAGNPTYITNKAGTSYFIVTQGDSIQDIDIMINYFGIFTVEYHLENNVVIITPILPKTALYKHTLRIKNSATNLGSYLTNFKESINTQEGRTKFLHYGDILFNYSASVKLSPVGNQSTNPTQPLQFNRYYLVFDSSTNAIKSNMETVAYDINDYVTEV